MHAVMNRTVDRRTRIGNLLLMVALFAIGPLAVYAPNGTVIVLGLVLLALLISAPSLAAIGRAIKAFGAAHRLLILVIGLGCIWILAASFWAPVTTGEKAVRSVLVVAAGMAGLGLLTSMAPWRGLLLAVMLSGAAMLGLFFFETVTDGSLIWLLNPPGVTSPSLSAGRPGQNPVQQGTTILAVLLWPWLVMVMRQVRRPWLALPIVLLAGFVVYRLPMAASATAFSIGFIAFAVAWLGGRRMVYLLFVVLAFYIGTAPLLSRHVSVSDDVAGITAELPESWQHRLGIWARTADLIGERPLLGHGFHASRWVGQLDGRTVVIRRGDNASLEASAMPLHPHNAALQIWLELGAVGVALFLTLLFGLCRVIAALPDRLANAGATAATAAFSTIALLSFGFWQTWWQALIWLAAMLIYISAADLKSGQPETNQSPAGA